MSSLRQSARTRAAFGRPDGKKGFVLAVLGFMAAAPSVYAAGVAPLNLSGTSDVDVIAVTPRNQAVKPLVMAILTKEQEQRIAAVAIKRNMMAVQNTNHHP